MEMNLVEADIIDDSIGPIGDVELLEDIQLWKYLKIFQIGKNV